MINRNVKDKTIETLKEIYSHHENLDFENSLQQITSLRDNFDIKLMVVGHFSAGKSSLLNMLIGKANFLKEAQEPQTAIATELIYDETESAVAFDEAGNKEFVNDEQEYSPEYYNHLEYRINSDNLKKISDFTIVDTPGFDAGIETHAKALSSYIGMGSAYLVVIDQEKGGIDETTLEFIQEISNYSSQIAILINKCDKITASVADNIAEAARCTLETYGYDYEVYTVSKRNVDIADKLVSIISSFDAQAAFDKVMGRHLKSELISCEKILTVVQKKIFLDTFDLDADIARYLRLEEQLSGIFERQKEAAKEDLDNTVQEVINKIKSILNARAGSIVEALLGGNQVAAEAIILEGVRPIMLSTMKDISIRQIDSVTDSLDFTGLENERERIDLTDIAMNLANNIKGIIEEGSYGTKNMEKVKKNVRNKDVYQIITGITAIATDIIAPWLEIIIILLPDVINLLRGIFGESDYQAAKRRFVNNVIPQIVNKIYPQIKQNVETTTKLVLDEYEKMLAEKLEGIRKNMVEVQNKKKQKTQEFVKYKSVLSDDIVKVKDLICELE